MAYTIRGEGLRLEIALFETERLLLHEDIIPASLEKLRGQIEKDGVLKSPVIVDKRSRVVLDGMHRVTSLRDLGCRFTCVCFVDYGDPRIKVDRWCRVMVGHINIDDLLAAFNDHKLARTPGDPIQGGGNRVQLLLKEESYEVMPTEGGILSAFNIVASIEAWLKDLDFQFRYETEGDAMGMLERGETGFVLCPPRIDKDDVLDTVRAGRLFTSKSTRHIVPARPLMVDVPLQLLLDQDIDLQEANSMLSEMLNKRRLKRLPAGHIWNGRRYEETLYLFEDP